MDFQKVTFAAARRHGLPATCSAAQKPASRTPRDMVHGGVHGKLGLRFPFVKEAVERGYIVICPSNR